MDHKISVITCTLNSEKYIEENLRSVWSTSKHPFEQVIIDGFSTDKTLEIVEGYQKKGYNIRIVQSPPKGISDAFNRGVQESRGTVIQFLNSDDYIVNRDIFSIVEKEFDLGARWLYGKLLILDTQGRQRMGAHMNILYTLLDAFLIPFICVYPHPSTFMAKSIFEKYGLFDIHLKYNMDWDYWIRLRKMIKPKRIQTIFCAFRVHLSSATVKNSFSHENLQERIYMLKKYYSGLKLYSYIVAMYIFYWPVYWVVSCAIVGNVFINF